ncbi:hypothetical protein G6011_11388 [Alternaria panax]|uniref:BTB domain-containing protein n=1 Tax=Alternaria panax TaxID=48097 RepID=A0AAD4NS84_9PLEO|nr:hypothetical protein G6011_11388 [Alternaria panax]
MVFRLEMNTNTSVLVPKRRTDDFITSPLVKVLVGPDTGRSELYIHQSIIVPRSMFFANALSGRWNNSDTKTVDLYKAAPDLSPADVVHCFENCPHEPD